MDIAPLAGKRPDHRSIKRLTIPGSCMVRVRQAIQITTRTEPVSSTASRLVPV